MASPALAAPAASSQGDTVTATGTGQVRVVPANRRSNASIAAAVDKAQQAAIPGAIVKAHEYALRYATAAGLTLGAIQSVSDIQSGSSGYYGFGPFGGPFGPNQYCNVIRAHTQKRIGPGHKVTVIHVKRHRVCYVPAFATSTLTVTYSAS
ncbi:MAG: hypothetical protein ACR2MK_00695 [Solirubrobacteraceae bacterium]